MFHAALEFRVFAEMASWLGVWTGLDSFCRILNEATKGSKLSRVSGN